MDPTPSGLSFEVRATSGHARAGVLHTRHGELLTPAFQPVATQSSVKALTAEDVHDTGARIVIMNTYHLWLRPGPELVAEQGGLHAFSHWPHVITTDSGGFQAFSLGEFVKISEEGVAFKSHLDGRKLSLTPEEAMRVQGLLGSDIAMQLDVVRRAAPRDPSWSRRSSARCVGASAASRPRPRSRRCSASCREGPISSSGCGTPRKSPGSRSTASPSVVSASVNQSRTCTASSRSSGPGSIRGARTT